MIKIVVGIAISLFPYLAVSDSFESAMIVGQEIAPSNLSIDWYSSSERMQVGALRPPYPHFSGYRLRCTDCTSCHVFPYCKKPVRAPVMPFEAAPLIYAGKPAWGDR